ncbi:uncharacterized protein PFL1_04836 [Pseudozyma flocculosa PF-1]|uniref:Coupling of ubiquitin conjugation to ER degradation protein 1 n=2 Tax=Pseudozyma flocculosa TaxID=84751 RepID=A0A5C3F5F7_9BASI|nr:uncharacterized protein PFL1_04836 [Pseudozyma flocculosa PF-1]EPQ27698.1 hypothetical protein PFL1_04836 [Pseudozyma flocculosa PF-1]SPO39165.1 uncharacterized protein PSFLO_04644 [Pseudozyma flocculosa]
MNDSLGAFLAIAVLWLILRFAFGGSSSSNGNANAAGPSLDAARARQVPQHMVDAVKTLFPHVPEASIRYDLQRSGSAEATCDRILNEGGLPTPPAGFFGTATSNTPSRSDAAATTATHEPAAAAAGQAANAAARGANARASASSSSSSSVKRTTLISRFGTDGDALDTTADKGDGDAQGWAPSPEERAKRLEERKRRMVLEARKKLMERQAHKTE